MPELPEVETVVRGLRPVLVGRTIDSMWVNWLRTVQTPAPEEFAQRVRGQKVMQINRRAKYIVIHLEHDYLLVHLKMTGRLYVADYDEENDADKWVHVKFGLDENKELRFSDSRKFGRVYLTNDLAVITGGLGPEPLEDVFLSDEFSARLRKRNKVIKALLLDQTFVAGVGNIYADEALFRAGIHPLRLSSSLTDVEVETLYTMVRVVLNAGIDHEGASINWYRKPDGTKGSSQDHFFVYGRNGKPCVQCGTTIEKIRVAQRGTHYCLSCQPLAKG